MGGGKGKLIMWAINSKGRTKKKSHPKISTFVALSGWSRKCEEEKENTSLRETLKKTEIQGLA